MFQLDELARDRSTISGYKAWCLQCEREKSKAYYRANRERILEKAAAKRGPVPVRHCAECGVELEGGRRIVCSERCREARFKRLHPESYAKRERAKTERRRLARQKAREAESSATTAAG